MRFFNKISNTTFVETVKKLLNRTKHEIRFAEILQIRAFN